MTRNEPTTRRPRASALSHRPSECASTACHSRASALSRCPSERSSLTCRLHASVLLRRPSEHASMHRLRASACRAVRVSVFQRRVIMHCRLVIVRMCSTVRMSLKMGGSILMKVYESDVSVNERGWV